MTQVSSTVDQSIPVIDISPLQDGSDPAAVAQALLAASRNLGFIYVNGQNNQLSVAETTWYGVSLRHSRIATRFWIPNDCCGVN
jgi:hypothetical protein